MRQSRVDGVIVSGKADDTISHCDICDLCWEVDYDKIRNFSKERENHNHIYIYYSDFVTYGKVKSKCPRCLEESS